MAPSDPLRLARSNFFRSESTDSPRCSAAVRSGSQGSGFEEVGDATFPYTPNARRLSVDPEVIFKKVLGNSWVTSPGESRYPVRSSSDRAVFSEVRTGFEPAYNGFANRTIPSQVRLGRHTSLQREGLVHNAPSSKSRQEPFQGLHTKGCIPRPLFTPGSTLVARLPER